MASCSTSAAAKDTVCEASCFDSGESRSALIFSSCAIADSHSRALSKASERLTGCDTFSRQKNAYRVRSAACRTAETSRSVLSASLKMIVFAGVLAVTERSWNGRQKVTVRTRTTKSVGDEVLALDRTRVGAEGVTRRSAEARSVFGFLHGAMGRKRRGGVGTSSAATVVARRSSGNGFTVLELQLCSTSPGLRYQSPLPMRSRSSWTCSACNAVPRRIYSTPTVRMRSTSRKGSGKRIPLVSGGRSVPLYRRPSRHVVKKPMP